MRIINLVDSVAPINYGIWNTILESAQSLRAHNVESELWYPMAEFTDHSVIQVPLADVSLKTLDSLIRSRKLHPSSDIVVSHGCWRYATRWAAYLKRKGFIWIFMPHGMLDPWAMQQKKFKKFLYYFLIEKRLIQSSDAIRVVSFPEKQRLSESFDPSKIFFIPNGIASCSEVRLDLKRTKPRKFLFLSRLHSKKNVVALVEAWIESSLNSDRTYELIIAGPDQGELSKLLPILQKSSSVKYVGSIYADAKDELLNESSFFVLPSFSEGLPTSVLEAMSRGVIPIITEECNLPDVFAQNLGIKISTHKESIRKALNATPDWNDARFNQTALRCSEFANDNFAIEKTVLQQIKLFELLMKRDAVTSDHVAVQ